MAYRANANVRFQGSLGPHWGRIRAGAELKHWSCSWGSVLHSHAPQAWGRWYRTWGLSRSCPHQGQEASILGPLGEPRSWPSEPPHHRRQRWSSGKPLNSHIWPPQLHLKPPQTARLPCLGPRKSQGFPPRMAAAKEGVGEEMVCRERFVLLQLFREHVLVGVGALVLSGNMCRAGALFGKKAKPQIPLKSAGPGRAARAWPLGSHCHPSLSQCLSHTLGAPSPSLAATFPLHPR